MGHGQPRHKLVYKTIMNKTIKLILALCAALAAAVTLLMCTGGCKVAGSLLEPKTNPTTGEVTHVPSTNAVAALQSAKDVVNTFAPGWGNAVYAVGGGILGALGALWKKKK
jgi:hypothetical protein